MVIRFVNFQAHDGKVVVGLCPVAMALYLSYEMLNNLLG